MSQTPQARVLSDEAYNHQMCQCCRTAAGHSELILGTPENRLPPRLPPGAERLQSLPPNQSHHSKLFEGCAIIRVTLDENNPSVLLAAMKIPFCRLLYPPEGSE